MYQILIIIMLSAVTFFAQASDHIERTGIPDITELTDFYAWTNDNKMYLALNTFLHPGNSDPAPEFDGTVIFKFDIKDVVLKAPTLIQVGTDDEPEQRNSVLRVPQVQSGRDVTLECKPILEQANCKIKISTAEEEIWKNPARSFVGRRADSFFLDVDWARMTMSGVINPNIPAAFPSPMAEPKNLTDVMNVLNLTLELDLDDNDIFGEKKGLIAVAASSWDEEKTKQFDRVGRPEITNMTMGISHIKKGYNSLPTFNMTEEQTESYEALMRYGVLGWDRKDGKEDWPHGKELHDLLEILVLDALVVDVTKSCSFNDSSFLTIERGQGEHQSCGGRMPKEDVIDTMFSLYTVGPESAGNEVGDGVTSTLRSPTPEFPFFAPPTF